MAKKMGIVILILLFLSSLFLISCDGSSNDTSKMGNTNGNLVNGSLAAVHNNDIYFQNFEDENKLYRINTDDFSEVKISDEQANFLNYYEGSLYFCNGNDNNKIYKMDVDGTNVIKISNDGAQNLIVANEWIYYIGQALENKRDNNKIFRSKIDGTERKRVNEHEVNLFNVVNDWIYFIKNEDQKLYRIKIDGTKEELISDKEIVSFIVTEHEILYMVPVKKGTLEGNNLWKMKLDGSNNIKLSEDFIVSFNVDEKYIYYSNSNEDSRLFELKRMTYDGKDVSVVGDDSVAIINILDNYLLYVSMDFADFSIMETITSKDGSWVKDYEYIQKSQEQDILIYSMGEEVGTEKMSVTVTSAYSTNIIENKEAGYESQIFDFVTDGTYLFINCRVENRTADNLDIYQKIMIAESIKDVSSLIYFPRFTDMTEIEMSNETTFHLKTDEYLENFNLNPTSGKDLQVLIEFSNDYNNIYPVYLVLSDSDSSKPIAAIEITPTEQHYVVNLVQAISITEERFSGSEITLLNGVGYKGINDDQEKFYYLFEVKKEMTTESSYYLVKRDTGEIFIGRYDPSFPDYQAIPDRLFE